MGRVFSRPCAKSSLNLKSDQGQPTLVIKGRIITCSDNRSGWGVAKEAIASVRLMSEYSLIYQKLQEAESWCRALLLNYSNVVAWRMQVTHNCENDIVSPSSIDVVTDHECELHAELNDYCVHQRQQMQNREQQDQFLGWEEYCRAAVEREQQQQSLPIKLWFYRAQSYAWRRRPVSETPLLEVGQNN